MKIFLLMSTKMPTIISIFIFISRVNFMLSWVEHEKRFITLGPNLSKHLNNFWLSGYVSKMTVRAADSIVPDQKPCSAVSEQGLHCLPVQILLINTVPAIGVNLAGDQVTGSTPDGSTTFFHGNWSWNIFYGHSFPSADSRRAVVSFWWKNLNNTG